MEPVELMELDGATLHPSFSDTGGQSQQQEQVQRPVTSQPSEESQQPQGDKENWIVNLCGYEFELGPSWCPDWCDR